MAAEVARAASAARDITACGAEDLVVDGLARHIARQEKAARRVAVAGSARLLCLAVGGWLPLLLVLAAAPGMLRHGASPGDIVGAITYITGSLRGVLYTLSQGMGAGLVRLNVTLERILQTSARPETPAETPPEAASIPPSAPAPARLPAVNQDQDGTLELRDVTFAYGPHAEPVISGLTLTIPPGDHLAVVGPSGIGKSSLAGLLAGMLSPGRRRGSPRWPARGRARPELADPDPPGGLCLHRHDERKPHVPLFRHENGTRRGRGGHRPYHSHHPSRRLRRCYQPRRAVCGRASAHRARPRVPAARAARHPRRRPPAISTRPRKHGRRRRSRAAAARSS